MVFSLGGIVSSEAKKKGLGIAWVILELNSRIKLDGPMTLLLLFLVRDYFLLLNSGLIYLHSGYYAIGANVTIVAIYQQKDSRGPAVVVVKDVINADLSEARERIRHLASMIKLVGVLRYLEQVIKRNVDLDTFPVIR